MLRWYCDDVKSGQFAAISVAAVLIAALGSVPAAAASGGRGQSHGHGAGHNYGGGGYGYRHASGARFVFLAGPAFPFGYYYPSPYYYFPPPFYSTPAPPTVYIELPQPAPEAYWYFCQATGTYYPYVQNCASGWQRMLPQSTPDGP
jgi:hypothetical protein